ncbi:unnamed protein product [Paramecium primaurelia]|uniref:Uncharacterized protein n=1 Tax=Paramecium primaurelia TaxID=5886 RepID=A0A8S1LEI6_PARPR|nr:unnamed protein product [Paramecium primaurelia]
MQPEYQKTLEYCQQSIRQSYLIRMQNSSAKSSNYINFTQYEILVQFLIQNALFCKSEALRYKTIQMLEQFEKQDHTQLYSIDFLKFNENPLTIEVSPLQSSFQLPLFKQFKTILLNNCQNKQKNHYEYLLNAERKKIQLKVNY